MRKKTVVVVSSGLFIFLTGCGVSTPGGYVLGTTGYLAEFNRAKTRNVKPEVTEAERQQLSRLVNKEGR